MFLPDNIKVSEQTSDLCEIHLEVVGQSAVNMLVSDSSITEA